MSTFAQQNPDTSDQAIALFNKGQDAHEKGDLDAAVQAYQSALKLLPEFPEAELQLGNASQSLGKLDDAERAFRRAIALREDWSLGLASLGTVLVRQEKFDEAATHLQKAIELDEHNFPALAAMTELRLKTNADPSVLRLLLARVTLITEKANPTASMWNSRAALELAVGDRNAARKSVARALVLDPRSQFTLATGADISLADNDPAAADGFVKRLEQISPASESVKVLRARILVAQAKPEEALRILDAITPARAETVRLRDELTALVSVDPLTLERQIITDPKNVIALSKLCTAFRTTDPAKALDYCRRASEVSPNDVRPVVGYGAALVQAKRYDDAVVILQRLLSFAPENATARANLATALFQLKRYADAKPQFRWLTENQPGQAIAFYFLGIVHDQLREFVDAMANYQQFLRLADAESSKLEIEKVNLRLPALQRLIKDGKGKKRG